MNLSYITRDFWAGAEETNVPRALAEAFVQRGHHVTVFSPKPDLRHGVHFGSENGIHTYGIPLERRFPALYLLDKALKPHAEERKFASDLWSLSRFLRSHQDVDVHLVDDPYPYGILMSLAARRYPSKWMLSLHSHWGLDTVEYPYKRQRSRFVLGCIRKAFRSATIIRANSFLAADRILKQSTKVAGIVVVPVNLGYTPSFSENEILQRKQRLQSELRKRFFFSEDRLIVSACRLDPVKGLDVFIRAAARVRQEYGEDVRFIIAGKSRHISGLGEYGDYLQRLTTDLGMADKITFTGHFPNQDMQTLLAGANINVVASYIDMLNMVVPEAGCVLTPSVVTRNSGISHWVEKYRSGIVVPTNAPEDLARAVMEILSDPAKERAMGRAALLLAENFTPDAVAQKIEQLLRQTLEVRRQHP
ncbi:MAG: glycosyltransferase family 4 protein [Deltaproteobacteria bacterium]|nr:glycosyltransferase family 4 protein [Deltaproteobacteria bacterium]